MEKIDFINNQQPALNATNLNKLQQNVEDAIEESETAQNNKIKTITTSSDTDTYSCNYINENKYTITKYNSEDIASWCTNNWSLNGVNEAFVDSNGIKTLAISIRNGTSTQCLQLPSNMKSNYGTRIFPAFNMNTTGFITLYSSGIIGISSNIYSSGDGSLLINITYY